jgi:hypothetical protein
MDNPEKRATKGTQDEEKQSNTGYTRRRKTEQHRVHKTKKNRTTTQYNICWTPLYVNKHK